MTIGAILDSGCDYLRFTTPLEKANYEPLNTIACRMQEQQEAVSNAVKDWRFQSYRGAICGAVAFGVDNDRAILQVSSGAAKEAAIRVRASGITGNCTRIDWQVTADYGEEEREIASWWEAEIRRHEQANKGNRRFGIKKYAGRRIDTGITAYARTGSRFVRLYHARSGKHDEFPDSAYRAEVEYKQQRSRMMWNKFCASKNDHNFSRDVVAKECEILGLYEPWMNQADSMQLAEVPHNRSDETTMNWLREQVMPAIARMSAKGHGAEIDAMFALARRPIDADQLLSARQEAQALKAKYFPWKELKNDLHTND